VLYVSLQYFSSNEFFTNKALEKDYTMTAAGGAEVNASVIKWKASQFAEKFPDSFFVCWFNNADTATEVAEIIKDEIWPDPARFYKTVCRSFCHLFIRCPEDS